MLAPRKPINPPQGQSGKVEVVGVTKRHRYLPFLDRLGFSLRLNLWYAGFFILGSFVLFSLAYFLLGQQLAAHDRDTVRVKFDAYKAWYIQGGVAELQRQFKNETDWEKATTFLEVRSTSQQVVFNQRPGNTRTDTAFRSGEQVTGNTDTISLPPGEKNMVWTIATGPLPDGCLMRVGRATEDRDQILRRFRTIFLFAIIPMVAFGFCCGAFITYRALRPIREIIAAVLSIIQTGDMSARVHDPRTQDEINQLVTLFNRMLERNESLIDAMRGSLDNVAHDLRTPLTRLQGGAQLALQQEDPEQIKEALADAVEEAERLNAMLCTIMDISEVEAGALKLELETFELAPVVNLIIELYEDVAQEKDITLAASVAPSGVITADRNRLQLLLSNLVDNAIKYTPNGGHVNISATFVPQEVRIHVKDSGIGIEPGDLPRIWDRLYRGDKSRSQRGIGLGLSMVKAFVEAHGGTATVESQSGAGSMFTVTFPRPQPPDPKKSPSTMTRPVR